MGEIWSRRGRSVCIPGENTLPVMFFLIHPAVEPRRYGTSMGKAMPVCFHPISLLPGVENSSQEGPSNCDISHPIRNVETMGLA